MAKKIKKARKKAKGVLFGIGLPNQQRLKGAPIDTAKPLTAEMIREAVRKFG